jgi:hypothetical protein
MVKIFTMVKDESDIVRDWVIYHGCMFGWDSIFVIDNYSTDGTWEILNEFSDLEESREKREKTDLLKDLLKMIKFSRLVDLV